MIASFDSLSEELKDRIIRFLDQGSLFSVSLTSRTYNRLATPHLFAEVHFRYASMDCGTKWLLPFTFYMFQNPYLASLVKSFSIRDTWGTECVTPEPDPDPKIKWARHPWPNHPDLKRI